MRRLLFLALFVALVAGMGFSQPVLTGNFQYGVMSDFKVAPEQEVYGKLTVTEPLDKFNTIVFRFRWKNLNFVEGVTTNNFTDIDRTYISSDVTGALGVTGPVSFKLGFGIQDPNGADLTGGISPFEVADLSGNDIGGATQPTIYPVFTINKMVNIGAIIAPGPFVIQDPATPANSNFYEGQGYEIFINGGQGPVMAEVGYGYTFRQQKYPAQYNDGGIYNSNNLQPLNFIWGAANYKAAQGDIAYALAVNGQYNLNSDGVGFMLRNHYAAYQNLASGTIDDVNWGFGVAASATYKSMLTGKVGFVGIEGAPANRLEAFVSLVADPKVTFDAGTVLNLNSDYASSPYADTPDMVNDFTVAATVNLGLASFRFGYLYIDKNAAYSVMSDDIGRVGDANGSLNLIGNGNYALPNQGVFIESILAF